MALFELEEGRLIPAQFGHPVANGLEPEVLESVRNQVLEIVSRPLFPITWRDMSRLADPANSQPRLTALDASGQVVSVEVLDHLDSETLIASLSRLADTASLSWTDLAAEYPGDVDGFKAGWMHFRDSMPPSSASGPRLVMVVGSIDIQVRPALDVLASSGVEVHHMSLRQMSNGRAFLEVQAVGPRLYGHVPQVLLGRTGQIPELRALSEDAPTAITGVPVAAQSESLSWSDAVPAWEGRAEDDVSGDIDEGGVGEGEDQWEDLGPFEGLADHAEEPQGLEGAPEGEDPHDEWGEDPDDEDVDGVSGTDVESAALDEYDEYSEYAEFYGGESIDSHADSERTEEDGDEQVRRAAQAADVAAYSSVDTEALDVAALQGIPVLHRDAAGLEALGQIIGEDAPLALRPSLGIEEPAALTASGHVLVGDHEFADPTEALTAVGHPALDGWYEWHLGDYQGPTLTESLDEVNSEIIREYHRAMAPAQS